MVAEGFLSLFRIAGKYLLHEYIARLMPLSRLAGAASDYGNLICSLPIVGDCSCANNAFVGNSLDRNDCDLLAYFKHCGFPSLANFTTNLIDFFGFSLKRLNLNCKAGTSQKPAQRR